MTLTKDKKCLFDKGELIKDDSKDNTLKIMSPTDIKIIKEYEAYQCNKCGMLYFFRKNFVEKETETV